MAAPKRTTFEVKVTNLLTIEHAFIQLQSTLRFVQTLSSTNFVHKSSDNYDQKSSLNAQAKSTQDAYSKANSNEFYNESNISSSGKTSSTTSHDAHVSGSGYGVEVDAGYKYEATNDSQYSQSNHQTNSGKSASSLSTKNALSNAKTDMINNIQSKKSENTNNVSLQSSVINKTIQPGFVRIVPGQTLSIPVVVESESQVVYLSVYISNDNDLSHKCIANHIQVNVQHIEIVKQNGNIAIRPMVKKDVGFRKLLQKWDLPESLTDCMEKCGWSNPQLWDNIRLNHLEEMGFKAGHIDKFNHGYKIWKKLNNWLSNDITYKALFELWSLPNYLYDNLIKNGWHEIKFWSYLIDDKDTNLKELGFKKGHIVTFKHHIKDNKHLNDWEKIKKEFKKNKENHSDSKYDYDDENDKTPTKPQFNVINITHNSAYIELLNVIKSNEYYRIELCEKHENDEQNLWNYIMKIKSGTGQKHKFKLDKMDTTYLVRIKCRNHQYDTTSDYTLKSFKTKNKQWRIDNIKDIKNFNYKIQLIHEQKLDFILIEFSKNNITNLNKDNINNNQYFIEIAMNASLNDDEKVNDKIVWNEIVTLNDKQTKYIVNYDIIPNKEYTFRIKSINDFEYIQYDKNYTVIKIVSEKYHPFGCRSQYEHLGVEYYHPQTRQEYPNNVRFDWLFDSKRGRVKVTKGGCRCANSSWTGCQQRFKCCKSTDIEATGCIKVYYHNCCNKKQDTPGCTQKYVCKQL